MSITNDSHNPYLIRVPKGMNFAVLRSLPYLGEQACGSKIREFLSKRIGHEVPAAKIYVALARLEDDALVTAEDEPQSSAKSEKRRRRRIYKLTNAGTQALEVAKKLYG